MLYSPRRLTSLYGDFTTHEQTNPEGYRANLEEWRNSLIAAARDGVIPPDPHATETSESRFVLPTGDHLLKALETRQFGIPVALGKVVVSFTALEEPFIESVSLTGRARKML